MHSYSNNDGLLKEKEVVEALNNKKKGELNANLQNFISILFPYSDLESEIKSVSLNRKEKPDFCVSIGKDIKYISMKTGRADGMHIESVKNFVLYLRSIGISKETQKTILLYQYGDGTMDGTGVIRRFSNSLIKTIKLYKTSYR